MDDRRLREYVNSLLPGLQSESVEALQHLADVLALILPRLFREMHVLEPEARNLAPRVVRRLASGALRGLPGAGDFYDRLMVGATAEAISWLHDLQHRAREWERAGAIQARLMTGGAVAVAGLEIARHHRPARDVTGDLHGIYDRGDGYALIALGDAESKGAPAAVYGAVVMGCLLSQAAQLSDPAEILSTVNKLVPGDGNTGHSATLTVALWNTAAREWTFANSGGPAPIYRRSGASLAIDLVGIPIGYFPDRVDYDSLRIRAASGDLLVLSSDGVPDQKGWNGMYGSDRLAALVDRMADRCCEEVCAAIFDDLDAFAAGEPVSDDQTVIVVRVKE